MRTLTDEEIELLEKYCTEEISDPELKKLEQLLLHDPDFREEARTYFSMDSFLNMDKDFSLPFTGSEPLEIIKPPEATFKKAWGLLALAASISFAAAVLLLYTLKETPQNTTYTSSSTEAQGTGFAVIDKMIDVEWSDSAKNYSNGDAIGQDKLHLTKGIIHLEFFCGASVIIEGPAEFDVKSSWEGFCHNGKLRANVPNRYASK
jgi:hypothetical protein